MSKEKLKVEVKTGSKGSKIAESNTKIVVAQASSKPKGKPVYKPKAKLTVHLRKPAKV